MRKYAILITGAAVAGNAFINDVLALYRSGRITEAVATNLITEAQGIINSIPG